MSQRSIRFPDELEALIEAKAKADDRSFSYVVIRALESALSEGLSTGEAVADARPSASSRAPAKPGPPSVASTWRR